MTRRIVHLVLLFAGLAPAVWAICIFSSDPRRAGVLATLAALGLGFNGIALARPQFGMRVPLRVMACGVGLIVIAGVIAMWQWLRDQYLPGLPASDLARRAVAIMAARNLLWIAAAVGYVVVTILVLPTAGPRAPNPP